MRGWSGFGRRLAVLLAFLVLGWATARAPANETGNGPGFLVISVSEEFETPDVSRHCQSSEDGCCHDDECECSHTEEYDENECTCELPDGSPLVVIPIGTFVAGYDVRNTSFMSSGATASDALAAAIAELGGTEGLDGHEATIFGAVDATGPNTVHLLTSDPNAVPRAVQQAVYFASPRLAALSPSALPSTTVELANFIFLNQSPNSPPATLQAILDAVVSGAVTLECTTCEAEGQIFPHDEDPDNPLLDYTIKFDQDGIIEVDACTIVTFDVKPGNGNEVDPINLGSKGKTPVAILSSRGLRPDGHGGFETITFFDPASVDVTTVRLGAAKQHGVPGQNWTGAVPVKSSLAEDLNGDGVRDLVLHFLTQDLANAGRGGLTAGTTLVEIHGETFDDVCFKGEDAVKIVPK